MSKGKASRPIYMVVRSVIDRETGEEVGALVPAHQVDRDLMRSRGYRRNDLVRAELKKPRNVRFHRLVHALGAMVAEQVEGFEGLDAHAVIKRLQRETGLFCETQDIDIPGFGKLTVNVAQSIAFDRMSEEDFKALWSGICRHLCDRYWPGLDPEAIEPMLGLMPTD